MPKCQVIFAQTLKEEHRTTLRGMVWFHVAVIVLLGGLAYIAGAKKGS